MGVMHAHRDGADIYRLALAIFPFQLVLNAVSPGHGARPLKKRARDCRISHRNWSQRNWPGAATKASTRRGSCAPKRPADAARTAIEAIRKRSVIGSPRRAIPPAAARTGTLAERCGAGRFQRRQAVYQIAYQFPKQGLRTRPRSPMPGRSKFHERNITRLSSTAKVPREKIPGRRAQRVATSFAAQRNKCPQAISGASIRRAHRAAARSGREIQAPASSGQQQTRELFRIESFTLF